MGQRCHCIGGIIGTRFRFIIARCVGCGPLRVGAVTSVLPGSLLDSIAVARHRGIVGGGAGCSGRVAAAAVHDLNQRRIVAVCAISATASFTVGASGTRIVGRRVRSIEQMQVQRILGLVLFFRLLLLLLLLCRAARLAALVSANKLGKRNIGRAAHGARARRKHSKIAAAGSTVLRIGGWLCSPDTIHGAAE